MLLGNGDGTFQPQEPVPVGSTILSLAASDFNGDGRLDLAIGQITQSGPLDVDILLGQGDGTFQAPHPTEPSVQPAIAADFNGDGRLDLAGREL